MSHTLTDRKPRGPIWSLPPFAVALATVAGLIEVVVRTHEGSFLGQDRNVGPDAVWAVPLSLALVLLPLALGLTALSVRWPVAGGRLSKTALLFVAAAALTLLIPRIHPAGALILAAGIAWRTGRWLGWRFDHLMPWAAAAGVVFLALAGWRVHADREMRERAALSRLSEAPAGAPNLLLIILDTVRGFNLSAYEYDRPTSPFITRLAEGGVRFDRAIATAPWTLPSHASLFTGRYPHQLRTAFRVPLDDRDSTLAEVLAARGYATGGFVANLEYTSRETGLARGFHHYEDRESTVGSLLIASWLTRTLVYHPWVRKALHRHDLYDRKPAARVNQRFLAWADQLGEGGGGERRPFFAFLNYYDAHLPYHAPAPYDRRFASDTLGEYVPSESEQIKGHSPREIARSLETYDGAIAYMDHEIGTLLAELGRRGLLDHTAVVITSDHGEQFGEHGRISHGNSLYRQLLQVPFIVSWPGRVPAGVVVHSTVSLRDVPATLLDLAGASGSSFPGTSLVPLWDDPGAVAPTVGSPVLSSYSWHPAGIDTTYSYSLVSGDWHYIRWLPDGKVRTPLEELFQVERDPTETWDWFGAIDPGVLAAIRTTVDSVVGRPVTHPPGATRVSGAAFPETP